MMHHKLLCQRLIYEGFGEASARDLDLFFSPKNEGILHSLERRTREAILSTLGRKIQITVRVNACVSNALHFPVNPTNKINAIACC